MANWKSCGRTGLPRMPEDGLWPDGREAMRNFYESVEADLLAELRKRDPHACRAAEWELESEIRLERLAMRKGVLS